MAAYTSTVVLDDEPVIVTVGLLALVTARLVLRPVPGDWAYALIAAVVGPAVEAALSAAGAFDYADPGLRRHPAVAAGPVGERRDVHPAPAGAVVLDAGSAVYRSRSRTSPPSVPT